MQRKIDARNVLYHFLQRDLHDEDRELFSQLTAQLVSRLGLWLSPELYARMPLLVPYARRDPHSRGHGATGIPDRWGSPDERGYFRDDNSLIKGIPRSLPISSSFTLYRGRQIGTGFVAAHVWRAIRAPDIAARNPLTYSFVPNLVWLPAQVAGLSDLEGSFVQRFLQRLSLHLYRDAPVAAGHRELVARIWELMPSPAGDAEVPLPPIKRLSFFEPTDAFVRRRVATLRVVATALANGSPAGRVVSTRYTTGIPAVAPNARATLSSFLDGYADSVADGQ